jgi:hypothetical protein
MGEGGQGHGRGRSVRQEIVVGVVVGLALAGTAGVAKAVGLPDTVGKLWTDHFNPARTCTNHPGLHLVDSATLTARATSELPAQGGLKYGAAEAIDGETGTAWVEGAPRLGVKQILTITLPGPMDVAMVCVLNGYAASAELYTRNARVRDYATVTDAGTAAGVLDTGVTGAKDFQKLEVVTGRTGTVSIRIVVAVPGEGIKEKKAFEDTAISEVQIFTS